MNTVCEVWMLRRRRRFLSTIDKSISKPPGTWESMGSNSSRWLSSGWNSRPQDSQCCLKIRYRQRLCRFDRVPLEDAGDHDPPAVISDLRFQIGLTCNSDQKWRSHRPSQSEIFNMPRNRSRLRKRNPKS